MAAVKVPPLNILVAYPYFNQAIVNKLRSMPRDDYRLIVDSGAFTAWNTGRTDITIEGYQKFLHSIEDLRPFRAVTFDVYGDPEKSWENFLRMKDAGHETMPVFTRGEDPERLEEMYQHSDYIMFGGIAIGGKNKNYAKWFLEHNKGRKVHLLGFTNIAFIHKYRPTSVDCSSWRTVKYGNVSLYVGKGKLKNISKSEVSRGALRKHLSDTAKLTLTTDEVASISMLKEWKAGGMAYQLSALSYVKRAMEIEKRYGTNFYFACSGNQIDEVHGAYCRLKAAIQDRRISI